jgi:hypothetical protein
MFSNCLKHCFFILVFIFYILNFINFINFFLYIYLIKFSFYKLVFFLEFIKSFFLFSFFNKVYYNYSKCFLIVSDCTNTFLHNYSIFSYGYSSVFYSYKYRKPIFKTFDFYDIKFDTFFYAFIKYQKPIAISLYNKATMFQDLYNNAKFSFFLSITAINIYKIIFSTIKLIHFYIIDSFKFNIYTDWVLNLGHIYFVYNINKDLYSIRFSSFFIKKKILSFLNSTIDNFF